jgi:hypothetical protein
VREKQADLAGAAAAYQQAIDSGHAEAAPKAALLLGLLRQKQVDWAEADEAHQSSIDPRCSE